MQVEYFYFLGFNFHILGPSLDKDSVPYQTNQQQIVSNKICSCSQNVGALSIHSKNIIDNFMFIYLETIIDNSRSKTTMSYRIFETVFVF